jgi:hypothetical protein
MEEDVGTAHDLVGESALLKLSELAPSINTKVVKTVDITHEKKPVGKIQIEVTVTDLKTKMPQFTPG